MAKFGEGDPRWLVQDRADGTNVNNWHWVEKDCMEWSRQRLAELFAGVEFLPAGQPASMAASGAPVVTGDAFINIRKNKLVPSYELNIAVPWSGEVRDGDGNAVGSARGKVLLPYVADENHDEDPEVRVTAETEDGVVQRLKEAFGRVGKKVVLDKVSQFVKELRAGGPVSKADAEAAANGTASTAPSASTAAAPVKLTSAKPEEVRKPPATKARGKLTITERFYARPSDILECFTDERRVMAYTQSPAKVEAKAGGTFSLFGGSVTGTFEEVTPSRLVQQWRFSTWEDGVLSKVIISLEEPEPGNTVLTLTHTDIPEADRFGNEDVHDNVEKGWRGQILSRIRSVFGYGV